MSTISEAIAHNYLYMNLLFAYTAKAFRSCL